MPSLLAVLFSLLFLLNESLANQEDDFLKVCPPSTCGSGSGSLQIRFPLRLRSAPASCGLPGLDLTCSGDDILLSLPSLPPFKVTNISYESSRLTLDLRSWFRPGSGPCPLLNLSSLLANLTTPVYTPVAQLVSWARCSTEIVPCSGPTAARLRARRRPALLTRAILCTPCLSTRRWTLCLAIARCFRPAGRSLTWGVHFSGCWTFSARGGRWCFRGMLMAKLAWIAGTARGEGGNVVLTLRGTGASASATSSGSIMVRIHA